MKAFFIALIIAVLADLIAKLIADRIEKFFKQHKKIKG